jgi:hypothetical protein
VKIGAMKFILHLGANESLPVISVYFVQFGLKKIGTEDFHATPLGNLRVS